MFDFIEEDLSSQKKEEKLSQGEGVQPSLPEPVVYSMPEKFRHAPKKGGMGPVIIASVVGGIFLLGTIGAAVYFFVLQPQQQPIAEQPKQESPKEEPKPEEPKKEEPPKEEPKPEERKEEEPQPLAFTPGVDTDGDLVSDLEERIYKTDSQKADSDDDTFADNVELENLYDPTHAESARLEASGLVSNYQNKMYNYSFLYPAAFTVNMVNQTAREIMVAGASTGEFFSIKVEDNPNALSVVGWYASIEKIDGDDTATLQLIERDTWSGVMSKDGLTVYLVPKNTTPTADAGKQPLVYTIHYDLNKKTDANLLETFQVILKSFVFLELSAQPSQ
ncbi:MAG: hypothetical protein Q7R79_04155 [bacterium]|nr:hypothetical protein [bacterium]